MALRARLGNQNVLSFEYDAESWQMLKVNHKGLDLLMPCCNSHAVPKTSKLNNYFFAHSKQGECLSGPETPEHIYLKTMIAKNAKSEGWQVITEKRGETPNGETWIADVYCTKGSVQIAFEVQWSYQDNDEFVRRTEKYTESRVRVAWLYRLRENKQYYINDLPNDKLVPVFGMKKNKEISLMIIPQFNVLADDFVVGVLRGYLKWLPYPGMELKASIRPEEIKCWKCGEMTNIINGISVKTKDNIHIADMSFLDRNIPELVARNVSNQELARFGIGAILKRYSNTTESAYLSNGCLHCNSLMGNFFLNRDRGRILSSVAEFLFVYDDNEISMNSGWYFKGVPQKRSY